MKLKVGDKVRVREDLKVGEIYGREIFAKHMSSFRGKTVEIDDVWNSGGYNLKEDDENWLFTDEMLEPITDPLAEKIEEQLFYVVGKDNTAILSKGIEGNPYPREGVFSDYFVGHEDYMLTEQEIKYYDPRYMTFAKPIEEFEE